MPWWGMEGQWTTNPLGVVFFIFNSTVVFNGPVRAHSEKYYFTCFRSHHKGPWMFTVKPGKLWTSEIFLECYCLAREKPIRHKKTKLQARTLISLWFCGQFACPDLCCGWSLHNKQSWDISSVHAFSKSVEDQDLFESDYIFQVTVMLTGTFFKTLLVYLVVY